MIQKKVSLSYRDIILLLKGSGEANHFKKGCYRKKKNCSISQWKKGLKVQFWLVVQLNLLKI